MIFTIEKRRFRQDGKVEETRSKRDGRAFAVWERHERVSSVLGA